MMMHLLINKKKTLPHERVGIWRRRRHFCVIQVLPTLSIRVEPRRDHGVAIFIQKLTNEMPGWWGEGSIIRVPVLLLP